MSLILRLCKSVNHTLKFELTSSSFTVLISRRLRSKAWVGDQCHIWIQVCGVYHWRQALRQLNFNCPWALGKAFETRWNRVLEPSPTGGFCACHLLAPGCLAQSTRVKHEFNIIQIPYLLPQGLPDLRCIHLIHVLTSWLHTIRHRTPISLP